MSRELQQRTVSTAIADLEPPLLKGMETSEVKLILSHAAPRSCQRGTILSIEGEPADCFFMVLKGRARYFTLTEDGHRVILRSIVPGELFGAMALVHDPDVYLVSTESTQDSDLLVWTRTNIRSLALRYPRLLDNLLSTVSVYFRWYLTSHLALISSSAPQRLARVLYQLANDIGRTTSDGIVVDITNEELADAAHITRFSTSRLLSQWQRKGIIAKSRGKLVLSSLERLFEHTHSAKRAHATQSL